MGATKDVYDIATDAVDRISGVGKSSRAELSQALEAIAAVLDTAREKFEKRIVPRREAYALTVLVNHAKDLARSFREKEPELARVFDESLPELGEKMKRADYFAVRTQTKNGAQFILQPGKDTDDPAFHFHAAEEIRLACETMERIAGTVSGFSIKYKKIAS